MMSRKRKRAVRKGFQVPNEGKKGMRYMLLDDLKTTRILRLIYVTLDI